jgi:hypothetical protein
MKKLQQSRDPDDGIAVGPGYRIQNCRMVRISLTKLQYGQDIDEQTAISR